MSDTVVLLILALALIIGAVLMGVFGHPWLCLLFLACLGGLSIRSGSGEKESQ